MGNLMSEESFIQDNIFQYENRMSSQYTRFLDRTPTYTEYYNISNVASTVDNGFEQSEELVGSNSSIRFNKISNFPIYGIEQVVLELQDDEEGLTTSYEGEAIILPNTVKPRPGDFFTISHLSMDIQFMVIEIKFDTIKSNNFYKISFMMKSLSSTDELENQVVDKFKCIATNIGTEDSCLIKEEEFFKLKELDEYIVELKNRYRLFFYSERHNMFLINHDDGVLHDPYLTLFLNKNNVFNSKLEYTTLVPILIGDDRMLGIFYELSMFRSIELMKKPKQQLYGYVKDNDIYSPIQYYGQTGYIISFPGNNEYLPKEFFDDIENNNVGSTNITKYILDIIIMYLNGDIQSINQIDIEKLNSNALIIPDRYNMIVYGILLYVLIKSYKGFISNKN